jgi:hypothetical protein
MRLDLERYLRNDSTERARNGRWTKGQTPDEVPGKASHGSNADASPPAHTLTLAIDHVIDHVAP